MTNPDINHRARIIYIVISMYCLFALAAPLLGYIVTSSHMRLSGDDYCYDGILAQSGFWTTQWNSYLHETTYSGNRYALTLFASLLGILGPKANAVAPGLFLVIWILSTIWLIKTVQSEQKQKVTLRTILTTLILIFFTLSMSPSLDQSLYWRSAMLPYFLPIVANTILIGMILHEGESQRSPLWRKFTILALAFLAGGFSETGAAVQMGYLSLWMIFALMKKKGNTEDKKSLYLPIGIALLGTAVSFLLLAVSPTNALRRAQLALPDPPNLPSLIQMSIKNTYLFIHSSVKWFFLPHSLILLYFFTSSWLHQPDPLSNPTQSLRSLTISILLLPFGTFALIMCIVAPSAWAQSSYPVARAMIMARWITVLASAIGGWIFGMIVKQALKRFAIKDIALRIATMLVIIALTAYPILELKDVSGELPRYQRWSAAWDRRDQQMREARAAGIMEINVMEIDHIIPDVTELKPNPDFWYNNCAEWYYDLRSIRANQSGWDD